MRRAAILISVLFAIPSIAADPPSGNLDPEAVSPRFFRALVHPDASPIWFLRYSADGRRLAAAGYPSGILQIWDPESGKELARVMPPPGSRGTSEYGALTADWKMAFTPFEGRTVVTVPAIPKDRTWIGYDGAVRVWDIATGKQRPPIKLAPGRGASVVVASPDGKKFVTIETQSYETGLPFIPPAVVYRNISGGGPPIELANGFGMAVFAPDGKSFVLTTGIRKIGQSRIRLFDAFTAKESIVLAEEPKANIFFPAFSPDGKRVAAEIRNLEETSSVVKVWDRKSGKELAVLKPVGRSNLFAPGFSADGQFVTAMGIGVAYVWETTTGTAVVTHRFGENGGARAVAIRPDNSLAAVLGTPEGIAPPNFRDRDPAHYPQPRLVLYDLKSGKPVDELVCPRGFPAKMTFSPDGKTLAVGGSGAVQLFDVADLSGPYR